MIVSTDVLRSLAAVSLIAFRFLCLDNNVKWRRTVVLINYLLFINSYLLDNEVMA
jgi:hypothetical protein